MKKLWKMLRRREKKQEELLSPGITLHDADADEDSKFFENLGTGLAKKVKVQQVEESLEASVNEQQDEIKLDDEQINEQDDEREFCKTVKRQELYTEKEANLKSNAESSGMIVVAETDSEPEDVPTAYNIVTESVGLNIEELYTSVLYITQHHIGSDVSDKTNQNDIFSYLQKVFDIDNETHEQMLEETRQMEAPQIHLNVVVSEAKELVPKDANGKSDPFCVLYLESSPTRRCNTAVKTETLTPVWHERFQMPLTDPENDVLCVEVWDFDAAETVPEKMTKVKSIKGVRGLVKLAKEIAITATSGNHDNEYIGGCQILLKDIPITGHSMWYNLEKKHKSKRRGLLKLQLLFNTEQDVQIAFQEHRHLIKMILLHELENIHYERYNWALNWEGPAEFIILQHGVQRGLKIEQMQLARWIEYSTVHNDHLLNFKVFENLSREVCESVKNNCTFDEEELQLFWTSTKKILFTALNFVRKIRRLQLSQENIIKQLASILRIVSTLSTLEIPEDVNLFTRKMYSWWPLELLDDDRVTVIEGLEFAVSAGASEWFEYLESNNIQKDSDEEALSRHIKIIQLARIDLQRAMEFYEKIFVKTLNFPYTKTLYLSYEKRVSDMCMIIIEDICGRLKKIDIEHATDPELNLGTTLFELYLTVQRFSGVGQNLCPEEWENLKVRNYFEWFSSGVSHWLEIAVYKAVKRIDRAVDFDNLQPVDSSVQYSSSAVDTLTIFYQIKVFWTQLAWPDVEGAYAFVTKIIDDICKCSIAYVDRMIFKAEQIQERQDIQSSNNIYGNHFDVSTAWCYAINNIDYIQASLEPLSNDLGLKTVIDALGESKSQQEIERCRETLQLIVDNVKETVKNKIVDMLETVANKMAPAMNRYLMEGAELTDLTSNSMDRLLEYLDSNLVTLHNHLNEDNFQRILLVVWDIMAEILVQLVQNNLERRRPPTFFSNLHKALHTLIHFFNLGADEPTNVKVLEKIEKVLKLYGLETNQLIHQYYLDRLNEQNNLEGEPFGMITVKAYISNNNYLYVQILNARNLKLPGGGGTCDSYVKIRLMPEEHFTSTKSYKTSVCKETFFPLYDENFCIPLENKSIKDALVMFEVKDKNFLRTRYMSEAFLSFNDIPQIDTTTENFNTLKQVHLNLSRPSNNSSEAIDVLSRRKGDDQASNFISKIKAKIIP